MYLLDRHGCLEYKHGTHFLSHGSMPKVCWLLGNSMIRCMFVLPCSGKISTDVLPCRTRASAWSTCSESRSASVRAATGAWSQSGRTYPAQLALMVC